MIENTHNYLLKERLVGQPNADADPGTPNLLVRDAPNGGKITSITKKWKPSEPYPLCTILEIRADGANIWYKILFDEVIQYEGDGIPGKFRIGYVAHINGGKTYFNSWTQV